VTSIYETFVARVAKGRGLDVEQVDAVGQGRVWTGEQAREIGLVDELGGLRTAARRAKLAAGLDPDADVSLIPYPPPKALAEQLSEALRRVAVFPAPAVPLPRLARVAVDWLASAPIDAPALLPPFVFEIR
jgi:protease-4